MQVVSPLLATLLCALLATLSAAAERDALIALYEATEGNSWTTSTGWNTTASVCDWYGVSCTNGTLIELDLTRNALSGDVDGVDLSQLGELQILRLRGNGLEGDVPVGFFALGAIRRIDLRDNQLTAFPTSTMNFSSTIEEVSISGNSIQCPVPAYVTRQLSSKFVDWSAADCVALKTPTVERSVTPQREEPVANNAIVQAFLNNHSSGIAAMRFQARNNARTPTAIWQSSVTRILYDILSRGDMGIPQASSANVTSSNDLFSLRNLTLSGDAWVGFIFTDNVTAVRRADLANRLFSQHPSVSTLLIRSTALFASVDQLDVVETPVPGPGVPQGDIDESNANTQIIVATVLFFVVVVAIGTFVCIRYKPFRRNTAVYRADGPHPPPPPGMVPPGGAPGGIPQQQVPGQMMGMAPPPGHTAVPMPGSAPGSTMPPSSAQQSAVPSGMATPLPPGSQTPTQQGPPVQHMPPPMMVPPGPPPGPPPGQR